MEGMSARRVDGNVAIAALCYLQTYTIVIIPRWATARVLQVLCLSKVVCVRFGIVIRKLCVKMSEWFCCVYSLSTTHISRVRSFVLNNRRDSNETQHYTNRGSSFVGVDGVCNYIWWCQEPRFSTQRKCASRGTWKVIESTESYNMWVELRERTFTYIAISRSPPSRETRWIPIPDTRTFDKTPTHTEHSPVASTFEK